MNATLAKWVAPFALLSLSLLGRAAPAADESGSARPALPATITPALPVGTNKPAMDRAVQKWTQRAAADPSDASALVNLGNALMQQARERPTDDLYDRAEAAFQKALSVATNHADALVGLAWVANTRHDFAAGTRYARQAIAADPRLQDAYALLGDAAVELGNYEEALEQYQKALDLAPNLASYSRAAHLLWLTGDSRKAQWLMQKAVAAGGPHAENTAWCRAELGLMLFKQGALLPAEAQIEQALAEAPSNPHVLAARGRIAAARTNYVAAIQFYEQALAIAPQHPTMAALTDLYALVGDQEKSARMFQRVLDFHTAHEHAHAHPHPHDDGEASGHPHVHGNAELAAFLADHDRNLPDALREAEAAYERFKNVTVTDTLAWCYHKNGKHQEARRTIAKALRWRTPEAAIHYHAGMIYAAGGERAAAQKSLYHALSLNPRFDPIQADLAAAALRELGARPPSPPAPAASGSATPPGAAVSSK